MTRLDLEFHCEENDVSFAIRGAPAVPRKGEGFRYKGINYVVTYIGWGFAVTKTCDEWVPLMDRPVVAVGLTLDEED